MRYRELTAKEPLHEGVRFGKRELNATLADIDEFVMGVEYEVLVNNPHSTMSDVEYMRELLHEYNIGNIEDVLTEHDKMTEVVTRKMGIVEGLAHIKKFFAMATETGMRYPSNAGMHVSISTKNNVNDVNLVKFMVLMAGNYLNKLFPERQYTNNAHTEIVSSLKKLYKPNKKITIERIENWLLSQPEIMQEKYTAINFKNYSEHNGRIEMRFFGGADYGDRYDELRWHIIRACFLLGVSYGTVYDNEYKKALFKLYDKAGEGMNVSLSQMFKNSIKDAGATTYHQFQQKLETLGDDPATLKRELQIISRLFDEPDGAVATTFIQALMIILTNHPAVFKFVSTHLDHPSIDTSLLGFLHKIAERNHSDIYDEVIRKQYIKLVLNGGDMNYHLEHVFGEIPEITEYNMGGSLDSAIQYAFGNVDNDKVMGILVSRLNEEGFSLDEAPGMLIQRVAGVYDSMKNNSSSEKMLRYLVAKISDERLPELINIITTKKEPTLMILFDIKDDLRDRLPTATYTDYLIKTMVYVFGTMTSNDEDESIEYYKDSESIMKEIIQNTESPTPFDQFIINDKFKMFIKYGMDIDETILNRYNEANKGE